MTRQERRERRRQRRRMQAALLASLLFALVLIVTLRIRETAPEPVAERINTLAAERQTLTYIAPARPEAAEETPEEPTVEPEPENRYAELHFSDEDVYTPITDKTTPIPATQLAYVKEEIYDYLGVSKEIVENSAFFKLQPGENDIIVEGGTTADVKILWKDRWL